MSFTENAWEDYLYWQKMDKKLSRELMNCLNILRDLEEYIYEEKENEQMELAKFDLSYENYHLEAFENILGFSGFKLFVKSSPPYNAEVIYSSVKWENESDIRKSCNL